jgi:N-carbamoylputrescine amidase
MEDTRIALAQISCPLGKIESNLLQHEDYIRKASAGGAAIICFPECSLTGYPLDYEDPSVQRMALSLDADPIKTISELGRRNNIAVIAGVIENHFGKLFNTQILAAGGSIVGVYRKTHLSDLEGVCFTAGAELPVWKIDGVTIGILICYDNHFPETARTLTLQGAEVLFCPYASPGPCNREGYESKQARWLRYLTARAFDNSLFLCVVNQIHATPGAKRVNSTPEDTHSGLSEYPGGSMVLSPWGAVIDRAQIKEDLLITDLKAEILEKKRGDPTQNFTSFLRPDLYQSALKKSKKSVSEERNFPFV